MVLHIRLQPRASQNRLVGMHAEALKIALAAPPVDGATNAALMTFVAQLLAVPHAAVSLQAGAKIGQNTFLSEQQRPQRLSTG